jgi:hypothetical protein
VASGKKAGKTKAKVAGALPGSALPAGPLALRQNRPRPGQK